MDASTKAYGAVVYLSKANQTSPAMSKSRVAPIKSVTLSKLELMAAIMGTRLANFIQSSIPHSHDPIRIHFWSDSQMVLHWIKKATAPRHLSLIVLLRLSNQSLYLCGHTLLHWITLPTSSLEKYRQNNCHQSCGYMVHVGYQMSQTDLHGYQPTHFTSKQLRIGRIHNAPTSDFTKFPYLLPPKHPLTVLIIIDTHNKLHHSDVSNTVTALHQVNWTLPFDSRLKNYYANVLLATNCWGNPIKLPILLPYPRCVSLNVHHS